MTVMNRTRREQPTLLTAHAGFAAPGGVSDKSEDNTIDCLIRAINLGAEAIEVDVSGVEGPDGLEFVITHFSEAPPADAPHLREIFDLLLQRHPRSDQVSENSRRVRLQLDVKLDGAIPAIFREIEAAQFPWDRIILAGDSTYAHVQQVLPAIREKLALGMELWMNPDVISSYYEMIFHTEQFIDRIQKLGLQPFAVNSYYKVLTDRILDQLTEAGLRASVWTVNDPRSLKEQFSRGLYNITSRSPALLALRGAKP